MSHFWCLIICIWSEVIHDTQGAKISQKQDGRNILNHKNNVPSRLSPHHHSGLYYAPCCGCWTLIGSLVSAMCNRTSCAKVHELPQSHYGDNRNGILFSWFHIYTLILSRHGPYLHKVRHFQSQLLLSMSDFELLVTIHFKRFFS